MSDTTQPQILVEIAELARTLGHAHRVALLCHISEEESPVERLAELSGLSLANASQHLQNLKRAGFVDSRRDGKRILYRLGSGPVMALLGGLQQFAEFKRAELRQVVVDSIAQPNRLQGISREELLLRLADGGVTLLDVRPEQEYALGHLPGALNIPLEELQGRIGELPEGQQIVAYCRGPYCVLSQDAVTMLRARGLRARRLESGFPDWLAAGLKVEAAS